MILLLKIADMVIVTVLLTCGSESIHNRNVIFRRSTMDQARILLHLKMRPGYSAEIRIYLGGRYKKEMPEILSMWHRGLSSII